MIKEKIKEIEEKYDMWADDYNLTPQEVEWLIEQAERVQELESHIELLNEQMEESYISWLIEDSVDMQNKLIEAGKKNKRDRAALEFYADKENYKPFDGIFLSSYQNKVDEDGGEIARKALKGVYEW